MSGMFAMCSICAFVVQSKCLAFAYECCVLSAIITQGLVPDERIFTALLTMHKTPKDYGWYMEVSQTLLTLSMYSIVTNNIRPSLCVCVCVCVFVCVCVCV